ncbi:uncharacterized protein LOC131005871 [Salvia miltiorrhiza]|uniref:uncharacterized protein LOC131005871 n=1 Tax=Salvia miltiorrhiza TaxID=226208 RepID=UPI0025AD5148|nr:uncharacterized protein LOC131005871 [Salvia miltiorrhiza]XP_057788959.1 uncharacterized protein LOC131005871 [Salvia miltiorrhiza]
MASTMEPVAVNSQKHDPAWKHCQMFKVGDKVQLKCIYCGKIFKGGGIHRIKEHLAGQKGNAATCLRVQPDVRMQMLDSLNGVAARKRKKQKLAEEMSGFGNPGNSGVEVVNGLNSDIVLLPVPEMIEHDGDVDGDREDGMSGKSGVRKKKGRVRKAPDVVNSNNAALVGFTAGNSKRANTVISMAVGRFFFDVGIPADAANSPYFQPMIDAIASQGAEAVGPSYHDLRNSVLKNVIHEVRYDVDQCSAAWGRTGCSILVDEWNSGKGKTFVNFFAYCPEGTVFLRSDDISRAIDSADVLYELLKEIVEQVGLKNVLQVVTTSEDRYVIAGKRLTDTYPSIFWTPCAGHCIDLMLQDIGELPRVKMILDQARSISRYIYSNAAVINMMRRYTYGMDLVDLGTTQSFTNFMTLKRMVNIRPSLQAMVTSDEWMESSYSKDQEAYAVLDSISSQSFWSSCASITRLTDPLLRLLRIARSQKMPAMGYVFAGLYRAKEAIKKELDTKEEYMAYWSIIDRRWEQLQRHPLHAAGFYLNPKFFYSLEGDGHLHIRSLVYDCIERLVPDLKVLDKIMKETASYHSGAGDFGRKMAIRARETLLPTEWWLTYGGGCPNLARLAVRILSQTCCLIQHKLDKIPLEHLHNKTNWLEHKRLNDLVYVQYNMSLKHMFSGDKQQEGVDIISYKNIDLVEDWVMEKDFCSENPTKKGWTDVDPPSVNDVHLGPQIDDVHALGAGFDDFEIFEAAKDSEEENADKNIGKVESCD